MAGGAHAARSSPRTWKLKVGGADPHAEGERVGRVLQGCVRRGLTLRLDANQAWTAEQVAAFGAAVGRVVGERCGLGHRALEYCEEPLREAELDQLPALYAAHGLRYALDESLTHVTLAQTSNRF